MSRYGAAPWRRLSPFHLHPEPGIPIPGRYSVIDLVDANDYAPYARSVEGIWQGLKVIEGQTDESLFAKAPKKRRGRPEGHHYGYRTVGYREAKALIYIPAYLHVLRVLEPELVAELRREPDEVGIVDVSYQPDCLADKPLSHAALLVDYLEGRLEPYAEADRRVLDLVQQMNDAHHDHKRLVPPLLEGIMRRALAMWATRREVTDYSSCAELYEREALLLLAVRCTGCWVESEVMEPLLDELARVGWVPASGRRDLMLLSPESRWWA